MFLEGQIMYFETFRTPGIFVASFDMSSVHCYAKIMGKWRENEEIKRKWREYEEIERKWTENEEMDRE